MDRNNVETIFPLAPMQQALLFHTLQSGRPDPGLLQLRCTLRGHLDVTAFERAWQHVLQRHQALRTSVHWEELDQPLQVVRRQVSIPWTHEDWRGRSAAEQEDLFLQRDREYDLDLSRAPVGRLALLRTDEEQWRLLWTCHHVLLDGWSGALVMQDVLTLHDALCRRKEVDLPVARPYRDYVAWLKQQESGFAEKIWKDALAGVKLPTPLPMDRGQGRGARDDETYRPQQVAVTRTATAGLKEFARRHRLTLNTIIQGAWALMLAGHSGRNDVVFGGTVSGRSADLSGIESIVGVFINTLPIRVAVAPSLSLVSWLQQLQAQQIAIRNYEHTPLTKIHAWSSLPAHERLFESLLVFENYAQAFETPMFGRCLSVQDVQSGITSNFPLTIAIVPADDLSMHVVYDASRFDAWSAKRLLDHLKTILEALIVDTTRPVADLLKLAGSLNARGAQLPPPRRNGTAKSMTSSVPFVAPRNDLERRLAAVWESTLGHHPIGVNDDFFQLGGHSMLAARLIAAIEHTFERKLPLAVLFSAPTVAQMARLLVDDPAEISGIALTPIQPKGSLPPLFCIHGLAGHIFKYGRLARHLNPGQPVYALQSLGFDGTAIPFRNIEEMAAHYLHEIRTVCPTGPYLLASNCAGGMIALEMARQLEMSSEEVALLAIFDPPASAVGILLRERLGAFRHRRLRQYGAARLLLSIGLTPPHRLRQAYVATTVKGLIAKYDPRPIEGRITVIRRSGNAAGPVDPGWSRIAAGGIDVHEIEGPHDLLQEPYVGQLGAQLQACIDRACRQRWQELPEIQPATPAGARA